VITGMIVVPSCLEFEFTNVSRTQGGEFLRLLRLRYLGLG
jgi:hypothetical protein